MERVILPRPTLIAGMGQLGTGKSTTFAGIVSRVADTVVLNKEFINDALRWEPVSKESAANGEPRAYQKELGTIWKWTSPYYLQHVRVQSYECMLQLGLALIRQGKHPILEGDYCGMIGGGYFDAVVLPAIRRAGGNIAFKIVITAAPVDVVKARVRARSAAHDIDYTGGDIDAYFASRPIIPEEVRRYSHYVVWTHEAIDWDKLCQFLAS